MSKTVLPSSSVADVDLRQYDSIAYSPFRRCRIHVTYGEAVDLGIDGLEHGLFVASLLET